MPGKKGEQGLKGSPGTDGKRGPPGEPGTEGTPGLTGTKGENGTDGRPGEQGPPGQQGETGAPGKTGAAGTKGSHGNEGRKGEAGLPGIKGEPDLIGIPGSPGIPGQDGVQGIPGTPGKNGDKGEPGKNGVDGIPGRDGKDGLSGIKGSKGEPGAPGAPCKETRNDEVTTEDGTQRQKKKITNNVVTAKERTEVDDKMMQNDSSETNKTDTKWPNSIDQFNEELKYQVGKMHDQFKLRIEIDHANALAKEIRDVFCQLSTTKKNQAIILSQTNGLLAASAIGLPVCSRVQGLGQTMILQQCAIKTVALTAIETPCGFQPFFNYANENFTIGMDEWSIHPYSACFWKSHFVNINGDAYVWEHNSTGGE